MEKIEQLTAEVAKESYDLPCKIQNAKTMLDMTMKKFKSKIEENKCKRVSCTDRDLEPIQYAIDILEGVIGTTAFKVQSSGRDLLELERLKYEQLRTKTERYETLLNTCVNHFTTSGNEEGKKYLIENGTAIQETFNKSMGELD